MSYGGSPGGGTKDALGQQVPGPPPQSQQTIVIEAAARNAVRTSTDNADWEVAVAPTQLYAGDIVSVNQSFLECRGADPSVLEFSSGGSTQNDTQRIVAGMYFTDCGANDLNRGQDWVAAGTAVAPATYQEAKTYKPCLAARWERLLHRRYGDGEGRGFRKRIDETSDAIVNTGLAQEPDPRVSSRYAINFREDPFVGGLYNSPAALAELVDPTADPNLRVAFRTENPAQQRGVDKNLRLSRWNVNLDAAGYWEIRWNEEFNCVQLATSTPMFDAVPNGSSIQLWGDWARGQPTSYVTVAQTGAGTPGTPAAPDGVPEHNIERNLVYQGQPPSSTVWDWVEYNARSNRLGGLEGHFIVRETCVPGNDKAVLLMTDAEKRRFTFWNGADANDSTADNGVGGFGQTRCWVIEFPIQVESVGFGGGGNVPNAAIPLRYWAGYTAGPSLDRSTNVPGDAIFGAGVPYTFTAATLGGNAITRGFYVNHQNSTMYNKATNLNSVGNTPTTRGRVPLCLNATVSPFSTRSQRNWPLYGNNSPTVPDEYIRAGNGLNVLPRPRCGPDTGTWMTNYQVDRFRDRTIDANTPGMALDRGRPSHMALYKQASSVPNDDSETFPSLPEAGPCWTESIADPSDANAPLTLNAYDTYSNYVPVSGTITQAIAADSRELRFTIDGASMPSADEFNKGHDIPLPWGGMIEIHNPGGTGDTATDWELIRTRGCAMPINSQPLTGGGGSYVSSQIVIRNMSNNTNLTAFAEWQPETSADLAAPHVWAVGSKIRYWVDKEAMNREYLIHPKQWPTTLPRGLATTAFRTYRGENTRIQYYEDQTLTSTVSPDNGFSLPGSGQTTDLESEEGLAPADRQLYAQGSMYCLYTRSGTAGGTDVPVPNGLLVDQATSFEQSVNSGFGFGFCPLVETPTYVMGVNSGTIVGGFVANRGGSLPKPCNQADRYPQQYGRYSETSIDSTEAAPFNNGFRYHWPVDVAYNAADPLFNGSKWGVFVPGRDFVSVPPFRTFNPHVPQPNMICDNWKDNPDQPAGATSQIFIKNARFGWAPDRKQYQYQSLFAESNSLQTFYADGIDHLCNYVPLVRSMTIQTPKDYLSPGNLGSYWTERLHRTTNAFCMYDGREIPNSKARGVLQNEFLFPIYNSWGNGNYPRSDGDMNRDFGTFPQSAGYAIGHVIGINGHKRVGDGEWAPRAGASVQGVYGLYPKNQNMLIQLWNTKDIVPLATWHRGKGITRWNAAQDEQPTDYEVHYTWTEYPLPPNAPPDNLNLSAKLTGQTTIQSILADNGGNAITGNDSYVGPATTNAPQMMLTMLAIGVGGAKATQITMPEIAYKAGTTSLRFDWATPLDGTKVVEVAGANQADPFYRTPTTFPLISNAGAGVSGTGNEFSDTMAGWLRNPQNLTCPSATNCPVNTISVVPPTVPPQPPANVPVAPGCDRPNNTTATNGLREDPLYRTAYGYPLVIDTGTILEKYMRFSQYVGTDNATLSFNADVSAFQWQFMHQPFATAFNAETLTGGDQGCIIFDDAPAELVNNWEAFSGINVLNWAAPTVRRGLFSYAQTLVKPPWVDNAFPNGIDAQLDLDTVGQAFMNKLGFATRFINPRSIVDGSILGVSADSGLVGLTEYIYKPQGTTGADLDTADAIISTSLAAEDIPNITAHGGNGQIIFYPTGIDQGGSAQMQKAGGLNNILYDFSFGRFGQRGGLKCNGHTKGMGFPLTLGTPQIRDDREVPRLLNPDGQQRTGYTVECGSSPLRATNLPIKLTDSYYLLLCSDLLDDAQFYISNQNGTVAPAVAIISKTYLAGDFYTSFQSPISWTMKSNKLISRLRISIRNSSMEAPTNLGDNSSVIFSVIRPNPPIDNPPMTIPEQQAMWYELQAASAKKQGAEPTALQAALMDFTELGQAAMQPQAAGVGAFGGGGSSVLAALEEQFRQQDLANLGPADRRRFFATPQGQALGARLNDIQHLANVVAAANDPAAIPSAGALRGPEEVHAQILAQGEAAMRVPDPDAIVPPVAPPSTYEQMARQAVMSGWGEVGEELRARGMAEVEPEPRQDGVMGGPEARRQMFEGMNILLRQQQARLAERGQQELARAATLPQDVATAQTAAIRAAMGLPDVTNVSPPPSPEVQTLPDSDDDDTPPPPQ